MHTHEGDEETQEDAQGTRCEEKGGGGEGTRRTRKAAVPAGCDRADTRSNLRSESTNRKKEKRMHHQ